MDKLFTRPNIVSYLVDIKNYDVAFLIEKELSELKTLISNVQDFQKYILLNSKDIKIKRLWYSLEDSVNLSEFTDLFNSIF